MWVKDGAIWPDAPVAKGPAFTIRPDRSSLVVPAAAKAAVPKVKDNTWA